MSLPTYSSTAQALDQLRARFEEETTTGFSSGESRIWGEADWERLLRGEYRHQPQSDSWATPPGWKNPRLTEDS